MSSLWSDCLQELEHSLSPQQFNSWISPLQAVEHHEHQTLQLLAPNSFIFDWVRDKLWEHIQDAFIRVRDKSHQAWQLTIDEGQFSSAMTVNHDPKPTPVVTAKAVENKQTAIKTPKPPPKSTAV